MAELTREQELLQQLQSDKRSVRIQAVVKLAAVGRSEESLKMIAALASSPDKELAFFAVQTAGKIAKKLGVNAFTYLNPATATQPSAPVKTGSDMTFNENTLKREDFLSPEKDQVQSLLNIVRTKPQLLTSEMIPAVGTFLSKYGDESDSAFIKSHLLQDNSNLCLPYLNAAERKAKAILPEVLPNLLASSESLVRSRAVSILQKIDPAAAEQHFADLLGSSNPENRLAAVSVSIMFPFERVKTYLITLLAEETDQDVISACRTVLVSNPSQDTALSLLDSYETVSGAHKSVLSNVFNFVCKAMAVTGLADKTQASPQYLLNLWKSQRLQKFLNDLEVRLTFADKSQVEMACKWLESNKAHPKVKEFINRLENNPQTENIYRRLMGLPPIEDDIFDSSLSFFENQAKATVNAAREAASNVSINASNENISKIQTEPKKSLGVPGLPPVIKSVVNKPAVNEPAVNEPAVKASAAIDPAASNAASVNGNIQNKSNAVSQNSAPSSVNSPQNNNVSELETQSKDKLKTKKSAINSEHKEIIKSLKLVELDNADQYRDWVFKLVSDDSPENADIKAEAINAMVRAYRGSRLLTIAKEGLNSSDILVRVASFKALERTNPSHLKTILPTLLKETNDNLRVRIIRFAIKNDIHQALVTLENLLHSKNDLMRANAVSCLGLCPFEKTARILLEQLNIETHQVIAKQITNIILSNPSRTMADALDRLSENSNPASAMAISQARNTMADLIKQLPDNTPEPVFNDDKSLLDALDKETSPYSIEKVKELKHKNEHKVTISKDARLPLVLLVICMILFGVMLVVFMRTPKQDYSRSGKGRSRGRSGLMSRARGGKVGSVLKLNQTASIQCTIESIDSETELTAIYQQKRIEIKFDRPLPGGLKANKRVLLTIYPYNSQSNGLVKAKGLSLQVMQ